MKSVTNIQGVRLAARRNRIKSTNDLLTKMVYNLNHDWHLHIAGVKFSVKRNGHISDRMIDNDLDIIDTLKSFYNVILMHRCELAYFNALPIKPSRVVFELGSIRLCISLTDGIYCLRTIYKSYDNRLTGKTDEYIIKGLI